MVSVVVIYISVFVYGFAVFTFISPLTLFYVYIVFVVVHMFSDVSNKVVACLCVFVSFLFISWYGFCRCLYGVCRLLYGFLMFHMCCRCVYGFCFFFFLKNMLFTRCSLLCFFLKKTVYVVCWYVFCRLYMFIVVTFIVFVVFSCFVLFLFCVYRFCRCLCGYWLCLIWFVLCVFLSFVYVFDVLISLSFLLFLTLFMRCVCLLVFACFLYLFIRFIPSLICYIYICRF